jgi:hypothetical protein
MLQKLEARQCPQQSSWTHHNSEGWWVLGLRKKGIGSCAIVVGEYDGGLNTSLISVHWPLVSGSKDVTPHKCHLWDTTYSALICMTIQYICSKNITKWPIVTGLNQLLCGSKTMKITAPIHLPWCQRLDCSWMTLNLVLKNSTEMWCWISVC